MFEKKDGKKSICIIQNGQEDKIQHNVMGFSHIMYAKNGGGGRPPILPL